MNILEERIEKQKEELKIRENNRQINPEILKKIKNTSPFETDTLVGIYKNQPMVGNTFLYSNDLFVEKGKEKEFKIADEQGLKDLLTIVEKTIPENGRWATDSEFFMDFFNGLNIQLCKVSEKIYGKSKEINPLDNQSVMDFIEFSHAFCYLPVYEMENKEISYRTFDTGDISPQNSLYTTITMAKTSPEILKNLDLKSYLDDKGKLNEKSIDKYIAHLQDVKEVYNLNDSEFINLCANTMGDIGFKEIAKTINDYNYVEKIVSLPEIQKNIPEFDEALNNTIQKWDGVYKEVSIIASRLSTSFFSALYNAQLFKSADSLLTRTDFYSLSDEFHSYDHSPEYIQEQLKRYARKIQEQCTIPFESRPEDFNGPFTEWVAEELTQKINKRTEEQDINTPHYLDREETLKFLVDKINSFKGDEDEILESFRTMLLNVGLKPEDKEKAYKEMFPEEGRLFFEVSAFSDERLGDNVGVICAVFPNTLNLINTFSHRDLINDYEFHEKYFEAGGSMEELSDFIESAERSHRYW